MSITDKQTKQLLCKEWDRLEKVIERFEEAWQGGQRPAIDDYLKSRDIEPRKLLLELVHADLECRLKAGEEVRVETYFERYPQIAGDPEGALGLIAAEYNFRQRRQPNLTPEDYERRFPQYRQELPARLLPLRQRECLLTHLSCPHCHKPIPISESAGEKQLTCSSCGGSFRFDLAHTPAWSPQALPRLGQFELLQEIGQGAFGTVYRARDADLGRIVAVKVPRLGRWLTPADQDRFLREARNVAQLAHPGIVPVYEVGRGAPVPYLVNAYVEGVTLAKALTGRRFGFREAAEVIGQVAEALDHAHRHGVVHRDLKPSNIMLGRLEGTAPAVDSALPEETASAAGAVPSGDGGEVHAFVMDFGLSRREEGEITVTMEGQILGTPAYMSPEQARGEGHHVDGRSDVYSLGVMLYELVTGEIPFRGVTRMVLQQIQFEEPRPPRRLNDKIPRDLETIALKCMAKEPGRRYATAGEVAADLRRHQSGKPIQARPVGRLERCWRWSKRNPRVAGLLGLVAVLIATGVVGSLLAALQIGQERDAAKEQLAIATDAVDDLVSQFQEKLTNKPGMQKLKENLLRAAIPMLERIARSGRAADASKDVGNSMGVAHQRLGDIFLDLGQAAQARQHYDEAHPRFEAYLAANPQNTKARRNLYLSYIRLGDTAGHIGDVQARREYYRKALELAQALVEAAPRDPQALCELSAAHSRCGDANRDVDDLEAALQDYRTGLEFARAAADVDPQSTDSKRALGECHNRIGEVLLMSGDFEAARADFAKALKLREAVAVAEPESRLALGMVALAHQHFGLVNQRLVNLTTALEHATKSVELREKLAASDPQDARARRELLQAYTALFHVRAALGDLAAVRQELLKALKSARELAADRDDIFAQTDLAMTYFNLASNEIAARDYEEAAKWMQQGVTLLEELQAQGKLKDQPVYQRRLAQRQHELTVCRAAGRAIEDLDFALGQPPAVAADLLVIRATALASRGQHVPAAATAEKLRTLDPKDPRKAYNVACLYALCVSSVGQGKSPQQLTPEETATRKRYAARAIELLAAAVQLGYKNMVKIETDPDLAAIRQNEGYQKLINSLKTRR